MAKIKVDVEIVPEQCIVCGTHFGIDKYLQERLRESRNGFYCPNGHSMVYTESAKDRRLRELEAELQEAKTQRRYAENRLTVAKRERAAAKGQLTKLKNRVHNGFCPICNRQFDNLARHMHGQHPDFLMDEDIDTEVAQ